MSETSKSTPLADAPTRSDRRRERTRAKLIQGALTVIADRGVHAATIQEITDAADVGFGSFYNHFESKEAALEAVIESAVEPWAATLAVIEQQCDDPAEVLSASIRHTLRKGLKDRTWGWFMVRAGLWMSEAGTGLARHLIRVIRRGAEAGRFSVADEQVVTLSIHGAVQALLSAMLEGLVNRDSQKEAAALSLMQLGIAGAQARDIATRRLPRISPRETGS